MKKILIVDDERNVRELIVNMLSNQGYQIDQAESGRVAKQKISQSQADFIGKILRS